jgi:conjugal transfer pilus assembly protein TraW
MKKFFIFFGVISAFTAGAALIELEPLGERYPIWEVDLSEYIASKSVDMEKVIREHFESEFREATTGTLKLPGAPRDEVRRITPEAVLTQGDIFTIDKDGVRRILYPKGYRFNPLDYVKLEPAYFIINGTKPAEVEWLMGLDNLSGMIILTEGSVIDLGERIKQPLYLLSNLLKSKFYLRYTPSIVKQEGNQLAIYEFYVEDKQ